MTPQEGLDDMIARAGRREHLAYGEWANAVYNALASVDVAGQRGIVIGRQHSRSAAQAVWQVVLWSPRAAYMPCLCNSAYFPASTGSETPWVEAAILHAGAQ